MPKAALFGAWGEGWGWTHTHTWGGGLIELNYTHSLWDPPIWKEKDKGRQTYWTRNRKREWTFFVGSVFCGRPFL